ncbi:MAG: hypothetical protein A3D31_07470 [Candidatus Fluviicola riflensis]|nr:MAG: hypothetical protein CHH17_07540 [Candidatus Fluviicola riflensis]OGS79786.1 MAG: hypothetical protein A3D31_07470 [Candidatus Fluviicola riflensis]OGS87219.1 MAG: hypothetical protein A2724_06930 [Fluviicola sp. RIFCSPHIGHO2_01_FULL_43_53]OGS90007.1 MAG: hypothetical protein A3E30_03675 [Fluviicola sp. RIFCSPHIGHO2_12_FULL_43_24]
MIDYETSISPFFEGNKAYLESLEKQLPGLQVFSGYCNAYGYDVEATFLLNRRTWNIQLIKSQTTRGGAISQNSTDHFEAKISVSGLNYTISFSLGRSFFMWILPSSKVPPPYFLRINSSDEAYIEQLAVITQLYEPQYLKQTTGELTGKFKVQLTDLTEFIDHLESLFA